MRKLLFVFVASVAIQFATSCGGSDAKQEPTAHDECDTICPCCPVSDSADVEMPE